MLTDFEQKQLMEENELLKKRLSWYQATYEHRSFPGIVWQGASNSMRRARIRFMNFLLSKKAINRKYVLSFAIINFRDHGFSGFFRAVFRTLKKNGTASLLHPRRTLLRIMQGNITPTPAMLLHMELPDDFNRKTAMEEIRNFNQKPLISFILPTYNTKPELLTIAINSIRNQLYDNWELCIVDDCSTSKSTIDVLRLLEKDKKIRVQFQKQNAGISETSNVALKMAKGDFVALMDHDDELTIDALYWIVKEINQSPDTDILYTDECKVDEAGVLSDYFFKPDWSPELLFNMMYVGHLTLYRRDFLASKVGTFRKAYDFSQDYDLMLRATEKTTNIVHIKRVLYHWRITQGSSSQGDKPYARISNLAALADAIRRRGIDAEILELPTANRVKLNWRSFPKVSIIVPTDSFDNLTETVESILANTDYPDFEIIAVTNPGLITKMKDTYGPRVVFVTYDKPYNFSDKCNTGAEQCSGDIVIFFNDDVRPLSPGWVQDTIEYLFIPGVGGVSPKLIYENDTIQYAGMATGVRNLTGTTFHTYHRDSNVYINFAQSVRNVSILSGACLAMKRSVFMEVGEFDPDNVPSAHSDVDLSFKIMQHGMRCVYTPHATLRHIGHQSLKEYESKQKVFKKDEADIFLLRQWMRYMTEDPYFTEPMRLLLYHDSPDYFRIFEPTKTIVAGNKGNAILVSHDLSLSGAPIMLYDTAKMLQAEGYFVVIFCQEDGPLREMYQSIGCPVIIDHLVFRQHESFARFARNFDLIICNTIVTWPVVRQMQDLVPTIWWIQEGQVLELFTHIPDVADTLRNARHLMGVSNYSISFVKQYNQKISKIHNASYDIYQDIPHNNARLVISLIGSIESRKGHDLLISALEDLDPLLLHDVEINFIGRILDPQFHATLVNRSADKPYIHFLGEHSHAECLTMLRHSDVIMNVSRDDPFPVVLVEAFCCGKPCVVSSHSGLEELIEDGVNGFIFKNEDSVELAKKLKVVLEERSNLRQIGANARMTYLKYLTMDTFKEKLNNYIESIETPEFA